MNFSSSLDYFQFSNITEVETFFDSFSVIYIISFLISSPINSYVIWLIVTETGNGLAAEFFILNLSFSEILLSFDVVVLFLFKYYKLHIFYHLNYNYYITVEILVNFFYELAISSRPLFECLICVERYLAVVHPVTFLKYKPLRYRLMCSAVVWVAAFGISVGSILIFRFVLRFYFIFLIVLFLIIFSIQFICILAVLKALRQSGPGERGRESEEENHMKRRAFYLILITTSFTLFTYVPMVISLLFVLQSSGSTETIQCFSFACFALVGLVQPFLFLYRVGKLNFINMTNEST